MNISNGIDILELQRMKRAAARERFLSRCFSREELQQFQDRNCSISYLAGNFCAKEAFAKALGTGLRGFSLEEVSVLRDRAGKPYLHLTGNALRIASDAGLQFAVSISNTREYAIAVVTAYSDRNRSKD